MIALHEVTNAHFQCSRLCGTTMCVYGWLLLHRHASGQHDQHSVTLAKVARAETLRFVHYIRFNVPLEAIFE